MPNLHPPSCQKLAPNPIMPLSYTEGFQDDTSVCSGINLSFPVPASPSCHLVCCYPHETANLRGRVALCQVTANATLPLPLVASVGDSAIIFNPPSNA